MIFLILFLGLILRLVNLNQSFWLDEAAQVIESSRPIWQQLDIASDFHPPLFHILLHFWLKLGTSEVWVRLLSVTFGMGCLWWLYTLSRKLFNQPVALWAAFFLSLNPYHIWYSQEARPYMLFVFLSLLSTYLLIKKKWFWYSLATVFLVYSLYFAPFLLLGHGVYIVVYHKDLISSWLKSLAVIVLAFIPWTPFFWRQFQIGTSGGLPGWIGVVSVVPFKAIPLTFAKFILGRGSIDNNLIYALAVMPVFLIFITSLLFVMREKSGKELTLISGIAFLSAVGVSMIIPVLAVQRLIFLLPFFVLFLAILVEKLVGNIKKIVLVILVVTSIYGLLDYYFNPQVQREKWRQAIAYVEKEATKEALVIFAFPDPLAPWQWYSQDVVPAIGVATDFVVTESDVQRLGLMLTGRNRLYYFHYLTDLTDPNDLIEISLLGFGFIETAKKDFSGVGFISTYEKALAQF